MSVDLVALAEDIGPRGTGTRGEAAAADYVAGRLASLGLSVQWQVFRAVASQNAFPMAINIVALLAVVVYPLWGAITRWAAACLALTTAPMLWQTIRTSNNPLRFLLPQVESRNVLTTIDPCEEIQQHAVVLAHLDTNRCRTIWQSSTVRFLEPMAYLTLFILASLGGLYLLGALLQDADWLWWISLLPTAYIIGSMISLWRDDRTPFSHGAHDNAASVAVALGVGARLISCPLQNTSVWLAFTGAEETDHSGLKALLDRYNPVLRKAYFLGLEGVGSGEIVYLTRQGLCSHYRPDPILLSLTAQVAARNPELNVHPARMTMEDEVGTLRRRGYQAICVAGMDPDTGSLPHWHRADDTVDSVSTDVMMKAADFVLAILKALDASA